MTDSVNSWQALWENLPIFKDAILTGGLAGALLGFIGVHVVLRRMVFASSAIASPRRRTICRRSCSAPR